MISEIMLIGMASRAQRRKTRLKVRVKQGDNTSRSPRGTSVREERRKTRRKDGGGAGGGRGAGVGGKEEKRPRRREKSERHRSSEVSLLLWER